MMTPERIAELREHYAELARMMDRPAPWSRVHMLATCGEAFKAAKTIPGLLDEIERLQSTPPPGRETGGRPA
jgi:hypothetical protein